MDFPDAETDYPVVGVRGGGGYVGVGYFVVVHVVCVAVGKGGAEGGFDVLDVGGVGGEAAEGLADDGKGAGGHGGVVDGDDDGEVLLCYGGYDERHGGGGGSGGWIVSVVLVLTSCGCVKGQ